MKHLLSLADFTSEEILSLFQLTKEVKEKQKKGILYTPLAGKVLGMIFQRPSTRTSVSFAVGMYQLGGLPLIFNVEELQLRRGETLADTARVFSRYVDGVMIRTVNHQDLTEFARHSTVPVINGLTNLEHPCQVLSDLYTISEKIQSFDKLRIDPEQSRTGQNSKFPPQRICLRHDKIQNLKVVFLGEGNNVANSWIFGAGIMGMNLIICTPRGYEPDEKIYQQGKKIAKKNGVEILVSHKPEEAVKDADVLYTDVWVSMGEKKKVNLKERKKVFQPYQLNSNLLRKAKPNCLVMHCLPAHRGEEITDEVIDGRNSVVFDQAENRLHLQKALLVKMIRKE
mgnify:CR=1 FL=1